jgi:hypothetical protein
VRFEPALSGLITDGLLHLREKDAVRLLCGPRSSQGLQRGDERLSWPVCPACAEIRLERGEGA